LWAGGLLGALRPGIFAAEPSRAGPGPLPRRSLGKTGVTVGILSLGTGTAGFSPAVSARQIARMVRSALEVGINFIDTARMYDNAEEGVALGLVGRRRHAFLATKVAADTVREAEQSLDTSMKTLRTDYLDLVYFHSVGDRDVDHALGPAGVFTWLVKQKQAGRIRFVGISGHNRPARFLPYIETGQVDVVLMAMNLVDRYTYGFEEKVLPAARKRGLGVLAMKVYGGKAGGFANYRKPNLPPLLGTEHLERALRYALGLPGVTAVNIGPHGSEELVENVEVACRFRPLSQAEQAELERLGRRLSAQWGEHFGPVRDEPS